MEKLYWDIQEGPKYYHRRDEDKRDEGGDGVTAETGWSDKSTIQERPSAPRERLPTPVFWPGEFHGLKSTGSQRVGHDRAIFTSPTTRGWKRQDSL